MSIKLKFQNPNLSIKSFSECELPNFVTITGINGSGKTHLLRSIEAGHILTIENDQAFNNRRFFDFSNLIPQDTGVFDGNTLDQERMNSWSNLSNHIQNSKNAVIATLRQNFGELVIPEKLKEILFGKLDLSLSKDLEPPKE